MELSVFDDGSTDGSLGVIERKRLQLKERGIELVVRTGLKTPSPLLK
jgi:glycosyltransferase involved in cell wall biosynthesis